MPNASAVPVLCAATYCMYTVYAVYLCMLSAACTASECVVRCVLCMVCLTPFVSLAMCVQQELNLYANVRPCFSLPGYKTKYDNVDLVTIRENTEGEYSGLEHEVVKGVVESLKVGALTTLCRTGCSSGHERAAAPAVLCRQSHLNCSRPRTGGFEPG